MQIATMTLMFVSIAITVLMGLCAQCARGLTDLHHRPSESSYRHRRQGGDVEGYTLRFSLKTTEAGVCSRSEAVSVDLSYRTATTAWMTLPLAKLGVALTSKDDTPSIEKEVTVPASAGSIQFRWLQGDHRGGCFDCWVIANVTITVPGNSSHPQPVPFVDHREGCNVVQTTTMSLCGGSASVPRGALAVFDPIQGGSVLPCELFGPLGVSGLQRCQSCPPESSEEVFMQVKFQLFVANFNEDMLDAIENFDEGVEFSVRSTEDNQWIPLRFFTNTSKKQLRSINIGPYDNISDVLSLRGYDVSVTNVPDKAFEVRECVCYSSPLNQVQFRWLQTTEHRANSVGVLVPRDTWYIDNVEISTSKGSCNQPVFSQDLNQTLSEIRGGEIKELMRENEKRMVLFFGASDEFTNEDPSITIITSRLAATANLSITIPTDEQCFGDLLRRAEQIDSEAEAFELVDDLISLTQTGLSQNSTQFSANFDATVSVLNAVTDFLNNQTTLTDANETETLFAVVGNVLSDENLPGFEELRMSASTQTLLDVAETIGNYSARAVANDSTIQELNVSRENIDIQIRTVAIAENEMAFFGTSTDDMIVPPRLMIPASRLQAIADINGNMSRIPVVHLSFQHMEEILPDTFNGTIIPRSPVISSQILAENELSQVSASSPDNLINLTFTVELNQNDSNPRCGFWNFSNPVGNGGWSFEGVQTLLVQTTDGLTVVECSSTHLTSFAVLVNVGGTRIESVALNIVSYVGCAISLACLLLSIIFFLGYAKRTVVTFVHLNLAIALFVGYLTFAVGTELAARNEIACKFVTALLHYFFLASFCWMLCEGIMIYLMLVVVFSNLAKKWWFFFILGWGLPLPFVAIGLATVLDEYGVRDDQGNLQFCWLSSGNGSHAIWTFVAPMIGIVVVNSIFLMLVLCSLYKNKGAGRAGKKESGKKVDLATSLVKASLIILPLLGLTWVFGLLVVNNSTVVFAYLFTIFNSLQGLFIFIFHVVHSEKIWGRLRKPKSKTRYTVSNSKGGGKGNTANGATVTHMDSQQGTEMVMHCEPVEKPKEKSQLQNGDAIISVVNFTESSFVPDIEDDRLCQEV